ncbi:MAG: hypothetical protein GXO26_02055 [Crenarchaeota archaeon]|nr:hypothetical protein [Thermoproteota archaeon]
MRKISPIQLARELSSLVKTLISRKVCIIPASCFMSEDAVQHNVRICRRALASSIVDLFCIVFYEPVIDSVNDALRSLNFILTSYFRDDVVTSDGVLTNFRVSRKPMLQVKTSSERLSITLPVRAYIDRVIYVAKCGSMFHGSNNPHLVPIARHSIRDGLYLLLTLTLTFYGTVMRRDSKNNIINRLELTDEEIGELIRQIYLIGKAKLHVNGSIIILERVEPCKYCSQDGSICLELIELAGDKGDIIIMPRLIIDNGNRRTVRRLKYVIVKGMERIEVHDRYIFLK